LSGRGLPDLLSVTGSDCFVEFPPLISERDQKLHAIGDDEIFQKRIDTNGFEFGEADGPAAPFEQAAGEKKLFYETAKFNPRELIEMGDMSVSSCKDFQEEAHLPTINLFKQNNRMRSFRGIRSVDEHSRKLA